MLGLNRAYVTKCGRLVGVVALRDLRLAVELIQSGDLIARKPSIISTESSEEGEEENLSKTFISNLEEVFVLIFLGSGGGFEFCFLRRILQKKIWKNF